MWLYIQANRLETELQYVSDERPDSILIQENNVLRRAVADLEGNIYQIIKNSFPEIDFHSFTSRFWKSIQSKG